MEQMSTPSTGLVLASTRLERTLLDALEVKAKANDRSISAELRRAVRFYLADDREDAEETAA